MNPPAQLIDDLRLLEPPNPWLIYYWIGGALLGFLVIFLLTKLIRKWMRRRASNPARQIRAAQEEARAQLEALFAMVEQGRGKEYATESSAIVRQYLERRFDLRAPTQSTEEFLHELQSSPLLDPERQDLLGYFLSCCDYLKFARGIAAHEELQDLHAMAVHLVSDTSAESEGNRT